MRRFLILEELESILTDAPSAAKRVVEENIPARDLFIRTHLPFLLLFPVFHFLSPMGPIFFGNFSSWKLIIPALTFALATLMLAITFDKILLHRSPPPTDIRGVRVPTNIALKLHLPVSASGFFFFFHPAVGFAMLFLSIGLSIQRTVRNAAALHELGRRRAIIYYLSAIILWLGIIAVILFLWNLQLTFGIIRRQEIF